MEIRELSPGDFRAERKALDNVWKVRDQGNGHYSKFTWHMLLYYIIIQRIRLKLPIGDFSPSLAWA